jgi:Ca2+-binding RTX toxin-like protein
MRRALLAAVVAGLVGTSLWTPAGAATPSCFGKPATVPGVSSGGWTDFTGTAGPDVIIGTSGNDDIRAGDGNDLICARGGYDLIFDGGGNDRADGGAGPDDFETQWSLGPSSGQDVFWGGLGGDAVGGLRDGDIFYGGPGNDTVEFDDSLAADRAYGEAGDDWLDLSAGGPGDVVNGGVGVDRCTVNRADAVTGCEELGS